MKNVKLLTNKEKVQLAEKALYGWDKSKNVREAYNHMVEYYKQFDFTSMSNDELCEHGFREWKDGNYLIPIYLYEAIPKGTKVFCPFFNEEPKNIEDADTDHRGGMLAYSFYRD